MLSALSATEAGWSLCAEIGHPPRTLSDSNKERGGAVEYGTDTSIRTLAMSRGGGGLWCLTRNNGSEGRGWHLALRISLDKTPELCGTGYRSFLYEQRSTRKYSIIFSLLAPHTWNQSPINTGYSKLVRLGKDLILAKGKKVEVPLARLGDASGKGPLTALKPLPLLVN
ncbi:hypothetical protein BJX65DRAFT_123925 [Aspergillus insuetus]